MTKTPSTEPEMTDVFDRFSAPLPPLAQPADDRIKISARQKASFATAAVLLGGATFAAVNPGFFKNTSGTDSDEESTPPVVDEDNEGAAVTTSVSHNTSSAVQTGEIKPNENIEIATAVDSGMSFGQAYAAAREEVGAGGIFSWRGEVYNTYTVEEWQGLSLVQRREFLADVGYRTSQQSSAPDLTETEPDIYEFVIDGRAALGIDDDHDGVADAIIFLDESTNDLIAFVDAEGDDRIDSVFRIDTGNQQIIGQETIEEPFLVDVQRLESWGSVAQEPMDTDLSFAANDDKTFEDTGYDSDYSDESGYINNADMPEMD